MSESERETLLANALVYEGQQHWLHYRHIEQERNQFLGFFFTLLVAVVGFLVAFGARAADWPTAATGLTIMAAVLFMITCLIFTSVRKLGVALEACDRDIKRIRAALFERVEPERTHLAPGQRDVTVLRHRTMVDRVFDPQFSAEVIVGTFAALTFGVQILVAVDSLRSKDFSTGQRALACTLAAVSVAGVAAAARLWVKSGRLRGGS
ncbi:hypothetical protein [Dactylosporangium sp. NPDC051541]|uniref:hypothetical protein n=1 Tax=Dactylosporangium sp. NPDC051541 TaxID=3363977 RepID=UPI00378A6833